jgi:hypothetical protein
MGPRVRGDDEAWVRVLATHFLCEFYNFVRAQKKEGAGKTGCALHPRSHVH